MFQFSVSFSKLSPLPLAIHRKEDVRATEKDKVCLTLVANEITTSFFSTASVQLYVTDYKAVFSLLQVETYKSFRPGDIVLAKVVSFICLDCTWTNKYF